jgi:hypothetical protein
MHEDRFVSVPHPDQPGATCLLSNGGRRIFCRQYTGGSVEVTIHVIRTILMLLLPQLLELSITISRSS